MQHARKSHPLGYHGHGLDRERLHAGAAAAARDRGRRCRLALRRERQSLRRQAAELLASEDAVLVAHYYVDSELQELAEETGGCVADSLEMARFGLTHPASTVVVAGVRFMGETAKILSPEKT